MTDFNHRVGFMQGRLSPLVDGKIQAFPAAHWQAEFPIARSLGFARMEWTLDHDGLADNPLMTAPGQALIQDLARDSGVTVSSITGDCFMQAPFWKAHGAARQALLDEFADVVAGAQAVGAHLVVVPLVDNGAIQNPADEASLMDGLVDLTPRLTELGVRVAFESDFPPNELTAFIARFPHDRFGINFDIGNSAGMGWPPEVEIPLIANRMLNVHVKDRLLNGTTVPLGEGNADLPGVFTLLKSVGYSGHFILQTARAADGDHPGAAARYRRAVLDWIAQA
ncbi:sugar phosphate isomerase/epimerase [Caulobacter sp. S45]|uniref:sugar phosphate isomerase/epimerase family protein n=1 Tax=Caulobacter sp. S45 TaxID=1641861 RepID=UPI00131A71EF|nr:sugar phosphate isomerase/epimerase family protein [Caulobacter sp. S45]